MIPVSEWYIRTQSRAVNSVRCSYLFVKAQNCADWIPMTTAMSKFTSIVANVSPGLPARPVFSTHTWAAAERGRDQDESRGGSQGQAAERRRRTPSSMRTSVSARALDRLTLTSYLPLFQQALFSTATKVTACFPSASAKVLVNEPAAYK